MRQGDARVIPTLLAYGARWVWLIPVAAIAPLSAWKRSLLLPVSLAFAVGLVGVMQFQWPHPAPRETCCRLTIVTLNGNRAARPEAFSRLVEESGESLDNLRARQPLGRLGSRLMWVNRRNMLDRIRQMHEGRPGRPLRARIADPAVVDALETFALPSGARA